jgi:ADP-ribosylglycohydrolase
MSEGIERTERILGGLWGAVVGDALGVPVEFSSREDRKRDPVTGMRGSGTHNQPPGTWSDDSSLLLCTVDSLINHEFDLNAIESGLKIYAKPLYLREMAPFRKFVSGRIHELAESDIESGGYVVDTLEASVWCFLNSSSFEEVVLKAINLGGDTDTTGCLTGGLAGIYHGIGMILLDWVKQIVRSEEINVLFEDFSNEAIGSTTTNGDNR